MNTKDIIYEMLTENTGRHFLDSGFSEGRGWQRNQKKTLQDFEDEDVDKYEYSEWTDSKGNEHAELTRTVSVFHYLSELETDSICEKFNDVNTKSNNWDSPLYGVSKEAYQYLTDEFETDVIHEFNTYNGDSDLSQVLQGSWLNVDGEFLQYPPFFHDAILPKWLLTLSLFLIVGIPFLILFVLGLRILSSSVKKLSKATSLTLLGIWIVALLTLIFTGLDFGTSHANYGQSNTKTTLNLVENDTITLKMINDDEVYYKHNLRRSSRKYEVEVNGIKTICMTCGFFNYEMAIIFDVINMSNFPIF